MLKNHVFSMEIKFIFIWQMSAINYYLKHKQKIISLEIAFLPIIHDKNSESDLMKKALFGLNDKI